MPPVPPSPSAMRPAPGRPLGALIGPALLRFMPPLARVGRSVSAHRRGGPPLPRPSLPLLQAEAASAPMTTCRMLHPRSMLGFALLPPRRVPCSVMPSMRRESIAAAAAAAVLRCVVDARGPAADVEAARADADAAQAAADAAAAAAAAPVSAAAAAEAAAAPVAPAGADPAARVAGAAVASGAAAVVRLGVSSHSTGTERQTKQRIDLHCLNENIKATRLTRNPKQIRNVPRYNVQRSEYG